eukprot:m.61411 g.61411  ORF g.61411 m.61411 type:complete len:154 (+) comp19273_c0_seq2:394-855(+)
MEKLTILKSLGILFGVAGAIVTTGKSMFEGGQFGTGIIFLACGVLGSALYYLTQKTVYPYYDPLLMTAMAYFFGALTSSVIGVSICTEQQDAFRMPGANKHLTWITLTYAIVFASCFCYWFMRLVSFFALLFLCFPSWSSVPCLCLFSTLFLF